MSEISIDEKVPKESIKIKFFCNHCNEFHKITVDKELFNTDLFPVSYTYLHGEPQVAAIIYIDANKVVRGVDYSKGFAIGRDQLNDILLNSKAQSLKNIPQDDIIAFRVLEEKRLLKFYTKQGFENAFNFSACLDSLNRTTYLTISKEIATEVYIKFPDYWIACYEMNEYAFVLVVSSNVDIDHLKTQGFAMFEALLS